jgi:hypothetical protein
MRSFLDPFSIGGMVNPAAFCPPADLSGQQWQNDFRSAEESVPSHILLLKHQGFKNERALLVHFV